MNDDRIDLSPLDPEADPERIERVVGGVLERLGPGVVAEGASSFDEISVYLTRRAAGIGAAAALLVAVSTALLLSGDARPREPTARDGRAAGEAGVASLDVPPAWIGWLATGRAPDTEDLLFRTGGDR